MKTPNYFKFSCVLLLSTLIIFLSSCSTDTDIETDDCDAITCQNGGICKIDEFRVAYCECPPGYSGVTCEISDCINVLCPPKLVASGSECLCTCKSDSCDIEIKSQLLGEYTYTPEPCRDSDPSIVVSYVGPFYTFITNTDEISIIQAHNFHGWNPDDFVELKVEGYSSVDVIQLSIPRFTDQAGRIFEGVDENGDAVSTFYTESSQTLTGTYTVTFDDGTSLTCDFAFQK